MAPSQMEHQTEQTLGQGYTHKKFNCGYSHKKLGMRLRTRQEENKENAQNIGQSQPTEENKSPKPCKGLFRPYALDDNNTPRKRKISRTSESSEEENITSYMNSTQTSPVVYHHLLQQSQQPQSSPVVTSSPSPPQTCASPALSPNSYALRLQRQRAALYMRYMSQFQQGSSSSSATTTTLQPPSHYATMGYPNVTASIFNGC